MVAKLILIFSSIIRARLLSSAESSFSRVFENSRRGEDDIYKKMADIRYTAL